jgi:hypothetical protein
MFQQRSFLQLSTHEQKENSMSVTSDHLESAEASKSLEKVSKHGETWVFAYDPRTKH